MGIDVYLEWNYQTDAEKQAQITGFSVEHGHVGYLREAYHGGPYAIPYLITEDWDTQPDDGFMIPAAELRRRLPAAVMVAITREATVYGQQVIPENADLKEALLGIFAEVKSARDRDDWQPNAEQLRAVEALISAGKVTGTAKSFVDFVQLAEHMERQTGAPCRVVVSA